MKADVARPSRNRVKKTKAEGSGKLQADETIVPARRRDGRVAEGGGLLNRYTGQNLYRGFESLSLRQISQSQALSSLVCVLNRLIFCFSVGF
jgi:hypothetical protein